jgi:hypothetical protein
MKKSRQVPLLVIGTVSLLAGCSRFADDPMELAQNAYASREDCRREWGNDDRNCQPSGHADLSARIGRRAMVLAGRTFSAARSIQFSA